jgi:hypothetical protein
MEDKKTAVFGIYPSTMQAERAVDTLVQAGFRSSDISVLLADNRGTKDFAHEKETKAPEGTAAGVTAGGIIGGGLGILAGIGTLAIPGLGPFIAAGPIMAGLAGLGVGGAVGGIIGALVGMGIPEYEAKRYEGRIRKGGILLSVHCDDREWVKSAREILVQTGAEDVSATTEAKADFAASDRPRSRTMATKA